MQIGINNIPPLTLGLLSTCLTLYYNFFHFRLPSTYDMYEEHCLKLLSSSILFLISTILLYGLMSIRCLHPAGVLDRGELYRLFTSVFFHADDMHIY